MIVSCLGFLSLRRKGFNVPEHWKKINGYVGEYSVSSDGGVFSYRTGKRLRHQTSKRGGYYPFVNLYKDGVRKNFTVHGLVAAAFLGKRPRGHEIHHKDEDRSNPALSNLEYITVKAHGKKRRKKGV